MEKPSLTLEIFEGPLDLLMHLIQKNKVSIFDIPVAEISSQYIAYLKKMKELDLEVASEFVVMAAQLLYIKSRMLLPKPEAAPEEDDPRQGLVERLLEYSKYKAISQYLEEREHIGDYLQFKGQDILEHKNYQNKIENVTAQDLYCAFMNVLSRVDEDKPADERAFLNIVGREKVPVQKKVSELMHKLKQDKKISYFDAFADCPRRNHMVAMFLGILELLKADRIRVTRNKNREICITLNELVNNGNKAD